MKPRFLSLAVAILLCVGCPKSGAQDSGTAAAASAPSAWVVFDIVQAGTGNPLSASVWAPERPDDFETILQGEAGSSVRFEGIGRRPTGFVLPFEAGRSASLIVWSPGHELEQVEVKIKKGENAVAVELRKAEVEDARVPERIRLKVLEALPTEGPRSGT